MSHGMNLFRLGQHQIQLKCFLLALTVYSLASGLSLGVVKFNSAGIVSIRVDGSAGPVNALFFRTGVVLARLLKELFC